MRPATRLRFAGSGHRRLARSGHLQGL